jgi:hypothetical protein
MPGNWRLAIVKACREYETDDIPKGQILYFIARKLVKMALDGDKFAIQELGDRWDGKAVQQVTGDRSITVHVRHYTESEVMAPIAGQVVHDALQYDGDASGDA